MGLRQDVARTLVAVLITSQILSSRCMPRNRSIFSDNKRTKKETCNNFVPTNISDNIRFPKVEYPFESEPEEYCRFLNEYPIQVKSINDITNYSSQGQNSKMETKCKRKLDLTANCKSKPEVATSLNKYDLDTDPEVYCFRRSSFFPEVEYPLSTRDMWMPNYWSRLQDVKIINNVATDMCSYNGAFVSNYDNSALSALIKALNTNKFHIPATTNATNDDYSLTSGKNDPIGNVMAAINTGNSILLNQTKKSHITRNKTDFSMINSGINPILSISKESAFGDIIKMVTNIGSDDLTSQRAITQGNRDDNVGLNSASGNIESEPFISKTGSLSKIVTLAGNTRTEYGSLNVIDGSTPTNNSQYQSQQRTIKEVDDNRGDIDSNISTLVLNSYNVSQTELTGILDTEGTTPNDSEIQTKLSCNSSRLNEKSSTENSAITTTTTSPSTNRFTSLNDYDSTRPNYFDISDMSTIAPFEYMTSPMFPLADDTEFSQPEQYLPSHVASETTTTTPISIVTTSPPACLSCSPTESLQNDYDYLIVTDLCAQNFSDIDLGNLTTDWVLSSNDSYVTYQFPNDSDDWVIYFDAGNTSLSLGNFSDITLTADENNFSDAWNGSRIETSSVSGPVMSTLLTTLDFAAEGNRSQEGPINTQDARDLSIPNTTTALTAVPETENVDINNFVVSSSVIEHNINNVNSVSSNSTTQDIQLNENTSAMVPNVPVYLDGSRILNYETDNTTQGVTVNEYAPIFIVMESDTNESNNTIDEILYLDNSNYTLQYEYIDDTMTFTEMNPENINSGSSFYNDSYVLYETICDYPDGSSLVVFDTSVTDNKAL